MEGDSASTTKDEDKDPNAETKVSTLPTKLRVAVEGCGHGTLHAIYASIKESCEKMGWDGVDLVIIGGDFQAVRNKYDLNVTAMPERYRRMADFHEYYSGARAAPYLTIFIGGNHEASNHLFELYYGGWVAPNIYYLGAANVLHVGNLRIAGLSGIWKGYDYRKPHFERLPYNQEELTSIFHVRELDTRKLLSLRTQVDIGLSHDWPKGVEWEGQHDWLFRVKRGFQEDAETGKLGNTAAKQCLDRLRPPFWFSAHLHVKYAAIIEHTNDAEDVQPGQSHQTQQAQSTSESHGEDPDQQEPDPKDDSSGPAAQDLRLQHSAWHDFHVVDRAAAQAELKQIQEEQEDKRLTGKRSFQNYAFDETFKKVITDDAYGRKIDPGNEAEPNEPTSPIPMLDGCSHSRETKRRRTNDAMPSLVPVNGHSQATDGHASLLSNPDAIPLSDSSDEEDLSPVHRNYATTDLQALDVVTNGHNSYIDPTNGASEAGTTSSALSMTIRQPPEEPSLESKNTEDVSPQAPASAEEPVAAPEPVDASLRAELAALSSNFAAEQPKPEVSAALPFPEAITNAVTHFLALDKCEPNKDFLQLLEIGSITAPDKPISRPVKLEYDAEWLAITRVFASELALGGEPTDRVPEHRGETFYRARIVEEEAWVQENVVGKRDLAVPENFTVTAPVYDEGLEVKSEEVPVEVTNPQTVAFCEMVGIECLFDVSEEEREARRVRGPRAESGWARGRGSGRGGRSGRGRGRGGRGRW